MLRALDEGYSRLLKDGTQQGLLDQMRTRSELYDLIEYSGYDGLDQKWAGS
jgi:methylisocitrate lyase